MKNKTIIQILMLIILGINQCIAQEWHTTGNGGTSPGSNFVGTTDAQPLNITTNQAGATGGTQPIHFNTNSGPNMTVDAAGNVGIGTTGPQQNLSIWNGMNLDQQNINSGTLTNALTFGSGSGEGIGSQRTLSGNQYGLDFYTSFTNRMAITNTGNVGIGIAIPLYKLDVDKEINVT